MANANKSVSRYELGNYIVAHHEKSYLSSGSKGLAETLAYTYFDTEARWAKVSQEALAKHKGVSVRTIRRWVKELKDSGLWQVSGGTLLREAGPNGEPAIHTINRYTPLFYREVHAPRIKKAPVSPQEAPETPEATTTPEEPEMPQEAAQEPADEAWMNDPYAGVPLFDDEPDYFYEPDWNE